MRGKLGVLLGLIVFAVGVLGWSAPAMAAGDTTQTLGTFSDPRNAMPARPGHTIKRIRMGMSPTQDWVIPANGAVYNNVRFNAPTPCTNCYITDMVPNLVYVNDANHPDGAVANLETDAMLHHFVLINGGRTDPVCPGGLEGQLGERFFAAGIERAQLHMPSPFGYLNNSSSWRLISHIINKGSVPKSMAIEVVYQYRPAAGAAETKPLWLDIDGCGDSEYTTPVGYNDATTTWASTVSGRMIGMAGHLHDVDVTNAAPCTNHCPALGHGIAVSLELVGGNSSDYFGPIPPNNPPPATLTGATMCRSQGYYGTAWAGSRYRGHLDTMSECQVKADALLPTAQAEAWPAGGELPSTGYPFSAGQTLKLHSEYQNNNAQPQTDVMGIMMAWYVPQSPGYPRPKGATPLRASLVPAYSACTAPNRVHGPPDLPGGANPDQSCSPPAQTSGQLTVGSPDAFPGTQANAIGSVMITTITGNPATAADEADARYEIDIQDVRRRSDRGDYTGQLQVASSLRITDKDNGPSETGVVQDIPNYTVTVPCTATTANTAIGSSCALNTTVDALVPGTIKEGRRAMWALGQVRVNDGGPDGVVSTTPNTLFMVQGVFVP
jgi:hypothetical protein